MDYYLPLYLWSKDCQRREVHPFWEVLKLISNIDSVSLFGLETSAEVKLNLFLNLNKSFRILNRIRSYPRRQLKCCHVCTVERTVKGPGDLIYITKLVK